MKHAAYILVLLALLIPVGSAYGDVACPPTDTGVPPTEPPATPVPPTDEPTPTSPPEWTATPWEPTPTNAPPEYTSTPYVVGDPTPTDTDIPSLSETPTNIPAPGKAGGTGGHSKKAPVEALPVTGGGDNPRLALGLTGIAGVLLLFVALLARRARNANQ